MNPLSRHETIAKSVVKRCQSEVKPVNWYYEAGVVVNDLPILFYRVTTIDIHRDFVHNFTDIITVTAVLEASTFHSHILRNLETLEGWITKRQMAENSPLFVKGGIRETRKYKVIVHNPPTPGLGTGSTGANNIINPNQSVITATFQFIDIDAMNIRLSTWQGLLEMSEPAQVLQMILSKVGKANNLGGVHCPRKWDVTNARQILIPRGTLVKDMPQYIQQEYGIFNHGIGNFIFYERSEKDKFWFIYPLFDNTRYEREYYKLTVCIVPKQFEPKDIPRTYVTNDGELTIYTVAETVLPHNKPSDQINEGTGIQVRNTEENRSININEAGVNRYIIDGTPGMSTFNVVNRKDGLRNYVSVYEDITNTAKLVSSIVGNQGTYLQIEWRFANPELLQPGMPVKVAYLDNDQLKTLYGTLHEYRAMSVISSKTAAESPFNCTLIMIVYVTPAPDVAL